MVIKQDTQWPVLSGWPEDQAQQETGKKYMLVIPLSERQHNFLKFCRKTRRSWHRFTNHHERLIVTCVTTAIIAAGAISIGSWLTSSPDATSYPHEANSISVGNYRPADSEELDAEKAAYAESQMEDWEILAEAMK